MTYGYQTPPTGTFHQQLPPVDPNYQYTPGHTSLAPDIAQLRARIFQAVLQTPAYNPHSGANPRLQAIHAELARFGQAHVSGGNSTMFGRIAHAVSNPSLDRAMVYTAIIGATAALGASAAGAYGAGGAGITAGEAGAVDPFLVGGGNFGAWAPIAGGAAGAAGGGAGGFDYGAVDPFAAGGGNPGGWAPAGGTAGTGPAWGNYYASGGDPNLLPTAPGYPGVGAPGVGGQAPNAFTQFMNQYGKFIGMGTSALGQYEQNRIQRQEFQRMQDAAQANRTAALGYASPENYNKLYSDYLGSFQEAYKPALLNQGEALALGEQGQREQFAGDVARRNMQGSGLAQMGPQAISAARQANYGQAVRGYYTSAAEGARNAASGTQAQQIGASLGAPVPYFPQGPSGLQTGLGVVGAGLGAYTDIEALQRRQRAEELASYGMAPAMGYYFAGQGPSGQGYYQGWSQPYGG